MVPGRLVVALLAALGLLFGPALPVGAAQSADPKIELPLERYELPNGLEVVLAPDDRLPTVHTNLWYHVGAADEAPAPDGSGRTGFAHLFEHMMFQGSGHVPEGLLDELVEGAGGRLNASTSFDYTNYYMADLPADRLEMALWLESDRMGFLLDRLDAASLANQQAVVRNERRQRSEQSAYGLSDEEVYAQLFPAGHPYRGAVIGSHGDIQAANLDDVREFFKTYYVPNNATLVVAGNFDATSAKAWITKYFGTIPAGPEPPKAAPETPRITAERRVTLTDEVELERVAMAWLTAPSFAPGDAEADVAAKVLGGGESSRLHRVLVREKKIAQSVIAYQYSSSHPSVFAIEAVAKPGHTAAELSAAIDAELAAQREKGPDAAEVAAARKGLIADLVRGFESVSARADRINTYNHFTGDPGYVNADIARYAAVDAAAVRTFVADSLRLDGRVVVNTVPGKKVLPPDPPAPEAPPAAGDLPKPAEPWRDAQPKPGPAPTVAVPAVRRFVLANGLPVYLVPSHTLPVVAASVVSRYGSAADPADRAGLAGFAATMLRQGTQKLDADGVAREVSAFGGQLETAASRDGSWLSVSALTSDAGTALGLASDLVRRPAFREADLGRVRDDITVGIGQRENDPESTAWSRLLPAVYGSKHPYGHLSDGTRGGVKAVTRADVVRFHGDAFTPATAALVLAGDLTPAQARTLAEKSFGDWGGKGPAPAVPDRGKPAAERVVVVDVPGSGQTALEIGQAGLPRSHPDYEALDLANQVLGGLGLSNRLMLNLRETRGYTYGMYSDLAPGRGPAPFDAYGAVQTQYTGESIRQVLLEIRRIRDTALTAGELRRAKDSIIGAVPALFASAASSVRAARNLYILDLDTAFYAGLAGRLNPLTADHVQAAARKHLKPGTMKVVAVGDRAKIAPQLAKLSLGKVAYRTPSGAPTPYTD